MTRLHIPHEALWEMPIANPYSLLVRDQALAWSCGQVPLDAASLVLTPGDLLAQARKVCDYIVEALDRADLGTDSVCKLVIYYVDQGVSLRSRMIDLFRDRFEAAPLLVPVPLPYFYYDGLLIEVDAFASAERGRRQKHTSYDGSLTFTLIDGGELVWAIFTLPGGDMAPPARKPDPFVADAFSAFGMGAHDLIGEHWFVFGDKGFGFGESKAATYLRAQGFLADSGAATLIASPDARIMGELTFVRGAGGVETFSSMTASGVHCTTRRKGRFLGVAARCADQEAGLVEQTEQIMTAIEGAIGANGKDFCDVVKSTTYYVGSSAPEELYDNMKVRNARYVRPGPASTGLPVCGLTDPASQIVVDVLLA